MSLPIAAVVAEEWSLDGTTYAVGMGCTWYDAYSKADVWLMTDGNRGAFRVPICPHCGCRATPVTSSDFEEHVAMLTKLEVDVIRWAQGSCFPDRAAMFEAYRRSVRD